jgi:hypothetical protein
MGARPEPVQAAAVPSLHRHENIEMKYFLIPPAIFLLLISGRTGIAGTFDHSAYDSLLYVYVENGLVDYKGIQEEKKLLTAYVDQLEHLDPEEFQTWSENEQKAFWINVYNAITIEGILRNYPITPGGFFARRRFPRNSIRQIGGFWDTVFVRVMGKDITLNQIEHEILRKEFHDPRIHFVLVCASIGCPLLEKRAFTPEQLDQRLDQAASNFIRDANKVRLDRAKNTVYLSSIFDWYTEDFPASDEAHETFQEYSKQNRGIVAFVAGYLPEEERTFIIDNRPKIAFLDYDWSLNEQH